MAYKQRVKLLVVLVIALLLVVTVYSQQIDKTQNPNLAEAGIAKSFFQQIGVGRGDVMTPESSSFVINRDPFRAIRRGRQIFQRKFLHSQGHGPLANDGAGDVMINLAIGAGLADSCSACHSRPRGGGGFGGSVATRPDSRDAPHLFGLGLKEMLADEMTADLRSIRSEVIAKAQQRRHPVTRRLESKGTSFGYLTAYGDGSVNISKVEGVDPDLRVRPFFMHGGTISMREFIVGAFNDEMGLQAVDTELAKAHNGSTMITPSGMVLNGALDQINAPPADDQTIDPDGDGIANEIPTSIVDFMEFYFLNYFKPATYQQTAETERGQELFQRIGCAQCHIPDLLIKRDRRVADVETSYDPERGGFNNLFATARLLTNAIDDVSGFPSLKRPQMNPFLVKGIFTDLKRHDLGPNFYERNYDGTVRTQFLTTPLWGVGSTAPYGHDGRSINLQEAILRHGGEAQAARDAFAAMPSRRQATLLDFLNSLVLFPPDDTASNLDPVDRNATNFPQFGHGSIKLTNLFNDPRDPE